MTESSKYETIQDDTVPAVKESRVTEVAVYYFPGFHADPHVDIWHGRGWTEWDLLRAAKPRFDGHRQPIVPELGYYDDSDPAWAAKEIDLAADHGVTTFLFDWYWYDGPFLNGALNRGFLGAENRDRLKFALMWANHNWLNIQPAPAATPYQHLRSGQVDATSWEGLTDHVLDNYMSEPNYLRIDNRPYFSIYEAAMLVDGLGGVDAAREALISFDAKARDRGHDGIHFNAVVWTKAIIPTKVQLPDLAQTLETLGIASVTSYVWLHHLDVANVAFPELRYEDAAEAAYAAWDECRERFSQPYFPNVTVGWDASPRTVQTDLFERRLYPWTSVIVENTPEALEVAVTKAAEFASGLDHPMITVNAWNEWTEGSYLLPDTHVRLGRLEALARGVRTPGTR